MGAMVLVFYGALVVWVGPLAIAPELLVQMRYEETDRRYEDLPDQSDLELSTARVDERAS